MYIVEYHEGIRNDETFDHKYIILKEKIIHLIRIDKRIVIRKETLIYCIYG